MSCKEEPKDESDLEKSKDVQKLHLFNDGQGWVVGIYDANNQLLQEINPQYKLD